MISDKKIIIQNVIEVTQPLGTFLIAKVKASELLAISFRNERIFNEDLSRYVGIQRKLKDSKIQSIKKFVTTRDATFPNTIIGTLKDSELYKYDKDKKELAIEIRDDANEKAFQVIDGQHRLWAFEDEDVADKFDLIVTFFLGLDIDDQAYIFSIINMTQSRLDPSLAMDLAELSKITTPENFVHSITKSFNNKADSPWHEAIKMIGSKDLSSANGIISQYTFNQGILNYIYDIKETFNIRNILLDNKNDRKNLKNIKMDSEKYIFWKYYVNSEELELYEILTAYFNALRDTFNTEWLKTEYILCKTTGYFAIMALFGDIYKKIIDENKQKYLKDKEWYKELFANNSEENIKFLNEHYPAGKSGAKSLHQELKRRYLGL